MKVAIVYASTTGNTEALAQAAGEAAKSAGREVTLATADTAGAVKAHLTPEDADLAAVKELAGA